MLANRPLVLASIGANAESEYANKDQPTRSVRAPVSLIVSN